MFRPFELALYSEGMSGLPGSLKKENIQQVPEVWASGKMGSQKMSPSRVSFGWERSFRSKLRDQNYIFGDDHPSGHLCPKQRSGGWRETGVFALSLIVEKQPGRSYVSTCLESPCAQLEGALLRQRPCTWKGTDRGAAGKRTLQVSANI